MIRPGSTIVFMAILSLPGCAGGDFYFVRELPKLSQIEFLQFAFCKFFRNYRLSNKIVDLFHERDLP
jgi:hypothetical protein